MKQPILHIDTNLQKLKFDRKFLVGHGQKWLWQSDLWALKLTVSQE